MFIKANDSRLVWEGVISQKDEDGSITLWRLPHEDLDLFPNEALHEVANKNSGVRLVLKSDVQWLKVKAWLSNGNSPKDAKIDLCIDNEIIEKEIFDKAGQITFSNLPEGMKVLEMWLPPNVGLTVHGIEINDDAKLETYIDKRLKWVTYGSSITHCGGAASPSMTWPAIVAREMNFNMTNLGFGGQCKVDIMVARLIRDMEADFISLKLGVNVYFGDLSPRTYPAMVIASIAIIREKHPETPLFVCSPIYCPNREITESSNGNNFIKMRRAVKAAVESFQRRGDKNIYYVNGLDLFGPELAEYLPDDLHPNIKGVLFQAENFLKETFRKYLNM